MAALGFGHLWNICTVAKSLNISVCGLNSTSVELKSSVCLRNINIDMSTANFRYQSLLLLDAIGVGGWGGEEIHQFLQVFQCI